MKKLFIIACTGIFAIGCNSKTESTATIAPDSTSTEKIDYAYLPANHPPDNWDMGSQKNVNIPLSSLKAFENGDIEGSLSYFADSLHWYFDGFDGKIGKDSMRALFKAAWGNMSALKIKMEDYESVISKDKKDEWVTMWYTQIMTDKSGKVDSAAYVNDCKIENGKITVLDEKSRKFPVKNVKM